MAQPKISVVIPAFNEEKYLPSCLQALANQTYPRDKFEIIVVDNNSTDRTSKIAATVRAKVVTEKKQGHVFALNAGMQKAQGEIIAVTDADTKVSKNWLETIDKIFDDQSIVGITGSIKLETQSIFLSLFLQKLYHLFLQFNFLCNKPHFAGPNMALRRSA